MGNLIDLDYARTDIHCHIERSRGAFHNHIE